MTPRKNSIVSALDKARGRMRRAKRRKSAAKEPLNERVMDSKFNSDLYQEYIREKLNRP